MKKLLLKTMLLLCALVAGMSSAWAEEVVCYTLTPAATGGNSKPHNSYADEATTTINEIGWAVTANSSLVPWRIGGKSITDVDRALYSTTTIGDNVTKIEVKHGTASSITVNSWTVIVAKDADFTNIVSTLTPSFAASTTTTINRPAGKDWTNCYYKFVYNVTVSGSSNKYFEFSEAKFYKDADSGSSDPVAVTGVTLNKTSLELEVGGTETLTATVAPADATDKVVTWSSSNTSVATVDASGNVKAVAVGTATITVTTEDGSKTATCAVTVTAPEGKETAFEGGYTSTFKDKNLNTDENNVDWSSTIEANQFETASPSRGVQFGAGKGEFTITGTYSAPVFKVSMVVSTNDDSKANTIAVKVGDEDFKNSGSTSLTLEKGNDQTVEFTGTGTGNIVISVNDANKSVYFKSITIYSLLTTKLNASGYATYCSEYPLDFSDYATADYSAWQVTGVSGDKITFEQITGSVKGGTGILLMGTAGATVTLNSVASSNTLSTNKLVGTLAPTYAAADEFYGLSGNEFVKVNAGTVPAGKALLPAAVGGVKALSLEFEGTDGISETVKSEKMNNAIYDLSGRRVVKPTKGLYIVNGKKIVK